MTTQKSCKRRVRARMEKTGQSYTTARLALLSAQRPPPGEAPVFTVSDDVIRRRTGRGWKEWLDLRDAWDAVGRRHGEIARWVAEEHGADGWSSQAITVSYERARGLRAVGARRDGFAVTEDGRRARRAALRRLRRRRGALAAGRRPARAHGHAAEIRPL